VKRVAYMELTEQIKEQAQRMGFDLVGVTHPAPSARFAFYTHWLAQHHHGEMFYLARPDSLQKRADPRRVMPEARSIVVVGMNYYNGEPPPTEGLRGRVSCYAWGTDYHAVLAERLRTLAGWIADRVGQPLTHRVYVDTGPLLERELAQRAGLGWIGKNTCLVNPHLGSYLFLGELLLDLELEPDPPFAADRCGDCTACLDACPTGALVAPRILDARRCLSYLTIEQRGPIPADLRPLLGDRVFGCDVCQEVCPWNLRFARPAREPVFAPRSGQIAPDLVELLALDDDGFRARFRDTPLWRARRAGLARNAAVALGNLGDPAAITALERALSDPEPLVAEHAAWALERLSRRPAT